MNSGVPNRFFKGSSWRGQSTTVTGPMTGPMRERWPAMRRQTMPEWRLTVLDGMVDPEIRKGEGVIGKEFVVDEERLGC